MGVLVEEIDQNADVLLDALLDLDPEAILPEEVAQLLSVDQFDGRSAISAGPMVASLVNEPVVMSNPFSPRPAMAPRKSRTAPAVTDPCIACDKRILREAGSSSPSSAASSNSAARRAGRGDGYLSHALLAGSHSPAVRSPLMIGSAKSAIAAIASA